MVAWIALPLCTTVAACVAFWVGRRIGYDAGVQEGFRAALKRSIAWQKPTDTLCRLLLPQPMTNYQESFLHLVRRSLTGRSAAPATEISATLDSQELTARASRDWRSIPTAP